MRLTARVPATSANLGPGFDAFALALDLCNEVSVEIDAEPAVTWEGEGADELPTDGSDHVSRAMRGAAARAGGERSISPVALHGVNRIPLQSGLGSSCAASVAGAALGFALAEPGAAVDPQAVFEVAAELEGHPDNAAAAAFGGFAIVVDTTRVARFDPHPDVRPVVLIPQGVRVSTDGARRVLPETLPRGDAVFNAGHAGLTAAALLRDPSLLAHAMRERLHEDRRLALVPAVRATFEDLRARGVPVCLSGSGPALLAFELDGSQVPDPGEGWRTLRIAVRLAGIEMSRS